MKKIRATVEYELEIPDNWQLACPTEDEQEHAQIFGTLRFQDKGNCLKSSDCGLHHASQDRFHDQSWFILWQGTDYAGRSSSFLTAKPSLSNT